jgi:hypothetical protein
VAILIHFVISRTLQMFCSNWRNSISAICWPYLKSFGKVFSKSQKKAVPYLRWLIAGFVLWKPRFNPRSGHVRFVVDIVTLERSFGFPCQPSFHRPLRSYLASRAGAIRPLVAHIPSGLCLTHPHELKKKIAKTDLVVHFLHLYITFWRLNAKLCLYSVHSQVGKL